ncbi:MAG: hypothetical protein GF317_19620 [Candidatus Lokiarchaeota archaeon]|nr:hypothetical protein [Candidatus Lokiarchaeota archaeon]MBD3201706.1 hypothetical protein [Candidatus Lokiarchaeota archaeon]
MNKKKFLLDTDIGSDIDDIMALLLCLRLQNFPLVAITTVYNISELRAKIARKIIDLENIFIPVGIGKDIPLDRGGILWKTGIEGKGLLTQEELNMTPDDMKLNEDGVDLLIEMAYDYAEDLEIISIGQFTNIATAIKRDPNFSDKISRIWSMSAGITFIDPLPENFPQSNEEYIAIPSHNIRCDVKAANIVLNSGIPITFIGNDVTTKIIFEESQINEIREQGSFLNNKIMDLMEIWLNYRSYQFSNKIRTTCLHDTLVVAEAYGMNFTDKINIDISIKKTGETAVFYNPDSLYEISHSVNSGDFMRWYLNQICA